MKRTSISKYNGNYMWHNIIHYRKKVFMVNLFIIHKTFLCFIQTILKNVTRGHGIISNDD